MIPNILSLLFERIKILPNNEIINLIEKESIFTIPKFIDILIELSYNPEISQNFSNLEAERILHSMVNSQVNEIILKHLFELQGPMNDEKVKTIRGNKIIKSLPKWKQDSYDSLIRQITVKPNGIFSVIKTLVDLISGNRSPELAFKIAMCICKPPVVNQEQYYQDISVQIIDLIQASKLSKIIDNKLNEKELHREYLRFGHCVGLECVHLYSRINRDWTCRFLLNRLFSEDLLRISDLNIESNFTEPEIVVDSENLIDCLNLINALLTTHQSSKFIHRWFTSFSPIFIQISNAADANEGNKFKKTAREIVVRLIELSHKFTEHDTEKYIRALCHLDSLEEPHFLHDHLNIRTGLDRIGLVVAVSIDTFHSCPLSNEDKQILILEELVDILICLPDSIKNDIVSSLCIWLLERRLAVTVSGPAEFHPGLLIGSRISELEQSRKLRDMLLYLLSTKMESNCFTKTTDILKFAQIAIDQYSAMLTNLSSIEAGSQAAIKENVNYALDMIKFVLERRELNPSDQVICKQLFPVLTNLIAIYPNDPFIDVITDICTVIATKGYVNPLLVKTSHLIEDIDEATDPMLAEALEAVEDPEISYKAAGLAKLHSLLKQKNKSAIRHRVKIYGIFSHYLFHSDSFLYVRAIKGLALLVDQFTDKLLPVIARKLTDSRSILQVEQWLTLSELYMQIISNLGQLAPAYRDVILNSILPYITDSDELVRTSAVMNLGELCCQLEYAFSPVMHEVVSRVCRVLESDPSVSVKVACSIMIRKLLLGKIDSTTTGARPEIIQLSSVLTLIRESLIRVCRDETDELVLDHASVANQALVEAIKSVPFYAASSQFERTIRIGNSELSYNFRKLNL